MAPVSRSAYRLSLRREYHPKYIYVFPLTVLPKKFQFLSLVWHCIPDYEGKGSDYHRCRWSPDIFGCRTYRKCYRFRSKSKPATLWIPKFHKRSKISENSYRVKIVIIGFSLKFRDEWRWDLFPLECFPICLGQGKPVVLLHILSVSAASAKPQVGIFVEKVVQKWAGQLWKMLRVGQFFVFYFFESLLQRLVVVGWEAGHHFVDQTSFEKCEIFLEWISLPKVHQSTAIPWPFLNKISGARYSGVPHIE